MCQQPGRLYGLYGSACRIKTREDELLQQYVCKQRAGAKLGQAVAVLLWHSGFGSTGNVIFLPHVVSVLSVDLSLTFFPTSQATYWKSFLPILLSCHFAGTTLKKPAAARRRGAASQAATNKWRIISIWNGSHFSLGMLNRSSYLKMTVKKESGHFD